MSRRNVELLRRAWEALATGVSAEAIFPFFSEDTVWHPFPEWPDGPHPRVGHEGIRELAASWTDNFDEFSVTLQEIREVGDRVVGLGEQHGRAKDSGVLIRQPLAQVASDFRDGKIGELRFFITWREALEAAGLSE